MKREKKEKRSRIGCPGKKRREGGKPAKEKRKPPNFCHTRKKDNKKEKGTKNGFSFERERGKIARSMPKEKEKKKEGGDAPRTKRRGTSTAT